MSFPTNAYGPDSRKSPRLASPSSLPCQESFDHRFCLNSESMGLDKTGYTRCRSLQTGQTLKLIIAVHAV